MVKEKNRLAFKFKLYINKNMVKKLLKNIIKAGLGVGGAYLGAKALGNRSKKNWIKKNNAKVRANRIGKIAEGVGRTYDHVGGDAGVATEIADRDRLLNSVYKKGGLVKKGKPKLAKRGWK